ncbi:hypothetical protein EST38_g13184 [Candolleomyces aberdarensis]|uniref:Uncharacterized protein n=1 Tax=Candolleomyces aberdarensis TaxID=2316362 RepID=A0A4Q2D0G7_9AGAR|nr:hypothetical protein EST38_g13184 [Candolleomyces aberdarensis]
MNSSYPRMLIIEYVAATAVGNSANNAIERKDKRPLPIPAYFMYTVKWSVLQYIIIRPAASIAGIVCEHFKVLCTTEGYTLKYAAVYIECINFISISIALYGLLVFCGLVAEELKGKRPVAKFLAIKLVVMFTFYQMFVFHWLEGRVIHETTYWTTTNIANGLNALAICVEMVFFAALMFWAYTWKEYKIKEGEKHTSIWKPLWDSINMMDFVREIGYSLRFFFCGKRHHDTSTGGVPLTKLRSTDSQNRHRGGGTGVGPRVAKSSGYNAYGGSPTQRLSFAQAFGLEPVDRSYARPYSNRQSPVNSNDNVNRTYGAGEGGGAAPSLKKAAPYGHGQYMGGDKEEREILTHGMSPLASAKGDDALQKQQQLHQQQGKYGSQQTTYVVGADEMRGKASEETRPSSGEGEDDDGGVDLGYYQSAYGGVEDDRQQTSYPPQQQRQQGYPPPPPRQQQQAYHPQQLQPQIQTYPLQTRQLAYNHQQPKPPSLQPQQPQSAWSTQQDLQPPQNFYDSSGGGGGGGGGGQREPYGSWAGPRAV